MRQHAIEMARARGMVRRDGGPWVVHVVECQEGSFISAMHHDAPNNAARLAETMRARVQARNTEGLRGMHAVLSDGSTLEVWKRGRGATQVADVGNLEREGAEDDG